ncbi:MAG: hypothetical protein JJT88_14330 [Gammaproteobacteria bacterium]|nr:hypothetical protein [Gammaproteobacteria bacterium]
MRALTSIVAAGLLAGCTTATWHRADTDETQVRRDLRGCEAVAARRYNEQRPQAEVAAAEATQAEQPDDEAASYTLALDTGALNTEMARQTEMNRLVRECMLALGYEPLAPD